MGDVAPEAPREVADRDDADHGLAGHHGQVSEPAGEHPVEGGHDVR